MITDIVKVNSKYKDRILSFTNDNELFIKVNLPPIVRSDNWCDINIKNKTTLVYFHSMLIIKDLTYFSEKNNLSYELLTYEIIKTWWETNKNNVNAWNEHAVSERIINFLYYFTVTSIEYDKNLFMEILDKHLEFLLNEENYKFNNHGLMMDRSLLIISTYLDDEKKRFYTEKIAISRFEKFISRDFSNYGIHLENSPEYHKLSLNIISQIQEVLNYLNIELPKNILDILEKTERYLPNLAMPNGKIPMIGDTSSGKKVSKKSYEDIVDYVSGIFVFQDKNYWIYMKNNFQKKTHKHEDLLGILYFINGREILIDSGKYNYDYQDEIRKYIVSEKAHNVPFVENKVGTSKEKNIFNTVLNVNSESTLHIKASNLSSDYNIVRNICFIKRYEILIIIDEFQSQKEEKFISNFVINPNITLNQKDNLNYYMKETDLIFKSLFHKIKITNKLSQAENWISYNFNEVENTNKLHIESSGNVSLHAIIIMKKKYENISINVEDKILSMIVENDKFQFNLI